MAGGMGTAQVRVSRGTASGLTPLVVFRRYCHMSKSLAPCPPDAGKPGILQQGGRERVLPQAGLRGTLNEARPAGGAEARPRQPRRTSPARAAVPRTAGEAR